MRTTLAFFVVASVTLCAILSFAAGSPDQVYGDFIDAKIAMCERKANMATAEGENMKAAAKEALRQVKFYLANRDILIQEMLRRKVGVKPHQISYFLIRTYKGGHLAAK